jgi:CheY-like chemotaxis protein
LKKLEDQLLQAQKMEAIGQLAGGIAHDFNNILTAIIGYSSLLQKEIMTDATLNGHITQILSAADKAANLTKSLLAFSRKQIINLKPIRLSDVLMRVEKLLARIIGEDIELKFFVPPHKASVMADAGQMEQVIMNLCANSKDAMPHGGILMIESELVELDEEYTKTHALYTPGTYMLISVADTGMGMDEDTKSKLFEPFFTTKEVGKGTGLGLSIVYGIIRQHNGYINVYSEKGRGTAFKIYLPVVELEAKALTPPALALPPVTGGTETILLAEDEHALRELSRCVLERHGYKVIEAVDGEDAIEKFNANSGSVDLLLLDVIMPKKTGKDSYDEIIKQRPDIKALFMSGYTANIIHKKGILKEGIELIEKPFSPNALLRRVRKILDKEIEGRTM